jgi:hypothetical protein
MTVPDNGYWDYSVVSAPLTGVDGPASHGQARDQ